jgi:acetyltransferase-like isoleucine patch superfamily enzyme
MIKAFILRAGSYYRHNTARRSELTIPRHVSLSNGPHNLDCTEGIHIGAFSTIVGYGSQLITHHIDYQVGRQDCHAVRIGDCRIVGAGCIVLAGAPLPNYCVLGAASVLHRALSEVYALYGGVLAQLKKSCRLILGIRYKTLG